MQRLIRAAAASLFVFNTMMARPVSRCSTCKLAYMYTACADYDRNLASEGRVAAFLLGFQQLRLRAPSWLDAMLAQDLLQMPTFASYLAYATSSVEARKGMRVQRRR